MDMKPDEVLTDEEFEAMLLAESEEHAANPDERAQQFRRLLLLAGIAPWALLALFLWLKS